MLALAKPLLRSPSRSAGFMLQPALAVTVTVTITAADARFITLYMSLPSAGFGYYSGVLAP
ncbi:MAG: hypothetical protein IPK80_36230 [Nannocystis sp.]|nr:hypothetical protein [Nannocystis sp.]